MYLRGEEELSFYGCHLCIVYKRLYRQPCSQLMQRTPQQLLHCLSLFIGSIRQYMSVVHYCTRLLFVLFLFQFQTEFITRWLITHGPLQLREYTTCLHRYKSKAINIPSPLQNYNGYSFASFIYYRGFAFINS